MIDQKMPTVEIKERYGAVNKFLRSGAFFMFRICNKKNREKFEESLVSPGNHALYS